MLAAYVDLVAWESVVGGGVSSHGLLLISTSPYRKSDGAGDTEGVSLGLRLLSQPFVHLFVCHVPHEVGSTLG